MKALTLGILILLPGLLAPQDRAPKNPLDGDQAAILKGMSIFRARCADCHGLDGKGVRGPDLTGVWEAGAREERLFQTIRQGVAGTEMPPTQGPDEHIWQVLAYLHSLNATTPKEPAIGDAENGALLFRNRCVACHSANGWGTGHLGPDLSRIGAQRSRAALEGKIRNANSYLTAGFEPVTIVTPNGRRFSGAIRNEDAYSIQILDTGDRILSFMKADQREVIHEKRSKMPDFGPAFLSRSEMDDLLSYLGALRGSVGAAHGVDASPGRPPVTYQDLLDGLKDSSRWLTYSGDYTGREHSPLTQITPQNVKGLAPQWTFQTDMPAPGRGLETHSLLVDGVLYMTGLNDHAWAIDARTGRPIWHYRRELPRDLAYCCGPVNRGFGVLGDRLFKVTLDAHLIALQIKTGAVIFDVPMEDYKRGYSATMAPLIVKNKVIVGIAGAEYPTRCFLDAYDATTGERVWRFYTVPAPGERGSETWPASDVMARGGGSIWQIGSFDPELNLVYFGTGNPNPDYYGADRPGDNLYTDSLLAIDADSGALKWYFQFTPHDVHDWDAVQVPVLADVTVEGEPRKVVMLANRNGFLYWLDRATGKLLSAKSFTVAATRWAKEIGPDGRPVLNKEAASEDDCFADQRGSTNFMPPSFNPALNLFFVNVRESCAVYVPIKPDSFPTNQMVTGGALQRYGNPTGALRALDASTGKRVWDFPYTTYSMAGVLTTASGLVFSGDSEGNFMALDAKTGKSYWHYQMGNPIWGAAPTTYMLDGRQWVLIPCGTTLVAFALPK